ncbi:hypothetical protein [Pseudomonas syringae]|nr:hypothetical protein [Pseudomonas syringae]QGG78964.1 hypothetical protein N028_26955 [Pseudomonas syringae USA011]
MNHHQPNQKPAQTSSKAMLKGKKPEQARQFPWFSDAELYAPTETHKTH